MNDEKHEEHDEKLFEEERDLGPKPIGFLTWWSIDDTKYERVNRAFRIAKLDSKEWQRRDRGRFIKRPTYRQALRRAAGRVDRHLRPGTRATPESLQLRPIETSSKLAHFALIQNVLEETGEISSLVLSEITATDKEEMAWTEEHPIVEYLHEKYKVEHEYCSGDRVSRVLVEIVLREGRGCCLRSEGGFYFLPSWDHENRNPGLVKLRTFAKEVGETMVLYVFTVYRDDRTRRSLIPSATTALSNEIDSLEQVISGWTGYKKKSLSNANLQRLLPIRKKIELYERRLNMSLFRLKKRCDEVATLFEKKLEKRIARRPRLEAPPPEPEISDGLNLKQRGLLGDARSSIAEAIERGDPYLRNICDVALAATAKDCGIEIANQLIEELGLTEKCGVKPIENAE